MLVPLVICRALAAKAPGQVELLQRPAAQIPHGTAHLHLALGHEIARQLKVVQRAIRVALVQLGRGVQLQERCP